LATVLRTQPNFSVHVAAAVVALGVGLWLRLSSVELAVLVLTCTLVLVVECINTALEAICDLVSLEYHPLIKRAKDVSAAAVLMSAMAAVAVALLLFLPPISRVLGSRP
jgi:diacylglycerol kinase (ATP)